MRSEGSELTIVAYAATYDIEVLETGQGTDDFEGSKWGNRVIYGESLRPREEETKIIELLIPLRISNCTTFENDRAQSRLPTTAAATSPTQAMWRERARCPGDLTGSGNVLIHAVGSVGDSNLIVAKRCFWARGTHDLETRRHCSSVFCSFCKISIM